MDLPEGVYQSEILPFAALLHGVKEAFAAPAFTSDYQTRADDILRCTKCGKVRFALARIVSAFVIYSILPAGGVGLQASILYAAIGFRFWNIGNTAIGLPQRV